MAKVSVYNLEGKATGDIELSDAVFGVAMNTDVVQAVARAQRANAHVPYAHAKGRADVRGGGKKPWRQKGTGNARHGSIRSPLWRGGGVTFGPSRFRNMRKKVNKKMKHKAVRMMLSDKVANNALIVLDSADGVTGKTKEVATFLEAAAKDARSTLIATSAKSELLTRAAGNLPKVNTIMADSLNVGDLLKYQYVVLDKAAIEEVTKRLG